MWHFGDEAEVAIVDVMRLREQMRPYVMEQYEAASKFGTPVMRPLFFDFPHDVGAQAIEDQLMFGPDYLLAPQLMQDGASRSVYLPALPKGELWTNHFTKAAHDTSSGGVLITEATPLSGPGLSTFPLYLRTKTIPPPPPPPPPPQCDGKCTSTAHTDVASYSTKVFEGALPTFAVCCAKCVANTACNVAVWGAFSESNATLTCFLLAGAKGTKQNALRTYSCVR